MASKSHDTKSQGEETCPSERPTPKPEPGDRDPSADAQQHGQPAARHHTHRCETGDPKTWFVGAHRARTARSCSTVGAGSAPSAVR